MPSTACLPTTQHPAPRPRPKTRQGSGGRLGGSRQGRDLERPTAHARSGASGAGPARAGSANGVAGWLGGSWPSRFPATRPISKSRRRLCGSDGRGPGALEPPLCPGSCPSRRPATPPWQPGCPSAPSRRQRTEAAAAAWPRPEGTPSPAWTPVRGPPRIPAPSRRRRAR